MISKCPECNTDIYQDWDILTCSRCNTQYHKSCMQEKAFCPKCGGYFTQKKNKEETKSKAIPETNRTEHEYLLYEMIEHIKTIKNCVVFFTVLTVISLVIGFILGFVSGCNSSF